MEFSERLKFAIQHRGISQAELSRMAKIDRSLICNYLSGKYKAKSENLYALALALNVSEAWLMGYDVPIERDVPPLSASELTDHEQALISAYRAKPDMQAAVDTLLGLKCD